jgi:hypothetical protein
MKTIFIIIGKFLVTAVLFGSLSGCIIVDIGSAGVFKEPIKYDNRDTVYIDIPAGIFNNERAQFFKDGSKISFGYLGSCGASLTLSGIMIPFFPAPRLNSCTKEGFYVYDKGGANTLGITFQLRYNGITYDSYFDTDEFYSYGNRFKKDYVEFKIPNFSDFKNAKDKTLIIHKKKPDGTMWSKELPFDWKIVVSVEGGL